MLASLLINAIVFPCFTDAWIFLTFLPYCVVCLAIAGFVFNIPFQIIYIIYYAVISDKNKILEHTKQFVLSVVLGGLSYFLSSHIAIFTVVAVIVGIVSSIKEQKGL